MNLISFLTTDQHPCDRNNVITPQDRAIAKAAILAFYRDHKYINDAVIDKILTQSRQYTTEQIRKAEKVFNRKKDRIFKKHFGVSEFYYIERGRFHYAFSLKDEYMQLNLLPAIESVLKIIG